MAMMYVSIGMIVGYILTSYVSYYLMPCIGICFPIIYLLAIIGLSETPQYLLRKGKDVQAEKSYYFYKNLSVAGRDNESAHDDAAKKEFETFKQQVLSGGVRQQVSWSDFCKYKKRTSWDGDFLEVY